MYYERNLEALSSQLDEVQFAASLAEMSVFDRSTITRTSSTPVLHSESSTKDLQQNVVVDCVESSADIEQRKDVPLAGLNVA